MSSLEKEEDPSESPVFLQKLVPKPRVYLDSSAKVGRLKTQKDQTHVLEEQPHCVPFCLDTVSKGTVSFSCGHCHCRYVKNWDVFVQTENYLCPMCQNISITMDMALENVLGEHKTSLKEKYQCVTKEIDNTGSGTLLSRVYTQLYVTKPQSDESNNQHEIWKLETVPKMETLHETPIKCCDMFKTLPGQERHIRVVLTNGLAGVGKTSKVQDLALDWVEGLEIQNVTLPILLPFRELNLVKDERFSLLRLIHIFHPALQPVTKERLSVCKPLFIFDGLDESRFSLDFQNSKYVFDVTQESSVSVLLTNLINGNLLPSAHVWITTRPAAANQIPHGFVDRLTEVRGFTDAQKEKFFRMWFSDEASFIRVISHIKTSRSLHVICQIPVLCWITATVLDHMLTTGQSGELPHFLTDLYSCFLWVPKKGKEYEGEEHMCLQKPETDKKVLLNLGKLALKHLGKRNTIFYREELEQCGLDVTEKTMSSGVCRKILKRECVIFQKTVYYFVHVSIQEFLASVYLFHCYTNRNTKVLNSFFGYDLFIEINEEDDDGNKKTASVTLRSCQSLDTFLKNAIEKSLGSENGHLDLFVRFLHGLSLTSNQRHLRELQGQTDNSPETISRVFKNLGTWDINASPKQNINLFFCMIEMSDYSVHRDIESFLTSENKSEKKLSEIHCSVLAYKLLMSEKVQDELDLNKYKASVMGKQRLIPAVMNCFSARLSHCRLSRSHYEIVALALKSNPSHLRELDLSNNHLGHSGMLLLSGGLRSPHCRLKSLRLNCCNITDNGDFLASALFDNPLHLRELALSENNLCHFKRNTRFGIPVFEYPFPNFGKISASHLEQHLYKPYLVRTLWDFLESRVCQLEVLWLSGCHLTQEFFVSLASLLRSDCSPLRELDLSRNRLEDAYVKFLCVGLKSPHCRLETLSLQTCDLSEISCASLASALKSNNSSNLRELDLSDNKLPYQEVKLLSELVESSYCRLQTLRFVNAEGSFVTLTGNQKINDSVEVDRLKSPGSLHDWSKGRPIDFGDALGPSCIKGEDKDNMALRQRYDEHPSTSKTNNRDEVVEYQLYPDHPEKMTPQHQFVCGADLNTGRKIIFTPELNQSGKTSYRFRCPGPGVFQCGLTDLVFVMTQKAELLYRTILWDEQLLQSAQKMAAGLLFDIQCLEDAAVCQVHLPHCEVLDGPLPEGLLSVAHISDSGMHILHPLKITDTHVAFKVPHFSAFGLVLDYFKRLLRNKKPRPVSGQVLLFLRQPNPKTQRQKLNVFLLPRNIHLDEVSVQQRHAHNIQVPSKCKLIKDQSYTLHCPQACKIQPKHTDFDLEFGPNYHPTFEVRLPTNGEEVTLTLKDKNEMLVWEHDVDLTDSRKEVPPNDAPTEDRADETLRLVRPEFVNRISDSVLKGLLDALLCDRVLNDEETQSLRTKVGADKARDLIDMVRKKGSEASSRLIAAIRNVDPQLSKVLKLS